VGLTASELAALEPGLRRRLSALWAEDGLMEHASIGSFARFSLQLLAVGAPPELLEGAHRAALDEVTHARLCFRLASAYADEPLGPGPLPLEGDALGPLELASVAAMTVIEGCIGETLAALEAATALESAEPEAVRATLERIREDETRHAELAYRTVRWALGRGEPGIRSAVAGAFRQGLGATHGPAPAAAPDDDALPAHGRLGARQRHELRRIGLEEVVRPAFEALLASELFGS
jgi:hypothetical protein